MKLETLIEPDRVLLGLRASDKAQVLSEIAKRAAAQAGVEAGTILAGLTARETLGSTGFGRGFALPHARIEGVRTLFGVFARLARPVDFEAIDGQPVDLVFALLIPLGAGQEHVAALAAVARAMRDETVARTVRKAANAGAVLDALLGADAPGG